MVIFDKLSSLQFILLLETNLLMSIFVGKKPFNLLVNNRIEIMNEFFLSSVCQSAVVITDYLTTNEDKYNGAWFILCLIAFTIFINISIVIWFLFGNIKLVIKKYYKRV
jgi:hypothetical protein